MSDNKNSTTPQPEKSESIDWVKTITTTILLITAVAMVIVILYPSSACGCAPSSSHTIDAELQYSNTTDEFRDTRTETVRVETMDADHVLIGIKEDRGYVYEGSYSMVTTQVGGSTDPRFSDFYGPSFSDGTGFLLDAEGQYVTIRGVEKNITIRAFSVKYGRANLETPREGRQITG